MKTISETINMTAKEARAISDKYFRQIVPAEQQAFILDKCCLAATNCELGVTLDSWSLYKAGGKMLHYRTVQFIGRCNYG